VLCDEQWDELRTTGVTRVRGAVPEDVVMSMTERIWALFERRGIRRDDRSTWPVGLGSKNQTLRQSGALNGFANDVTRVLVDDLLGTGTWVETEAWGPALVTWPQPGPWTLPHKVWHFDLPGRGDPDRPEAARLFGFLSNVGPRGGGTLVVEGSHELVRRLVTATPDQDAGQSSDLRKTLCRRHRWFAALMRESSNGVRQFMVDGDEIDGVRVRVAELTGEPGDVTVMLPWTMHNFSMNCASEPRLMVTHTVLRHDQRFYAAVPRSSKRGSPPA
jgi:hypothetical protein